MNSPWGIEYNIIEKLHFTRHYLLWKISWINVQMMMADAPSYKSAKPKDKIGTTADEFNKFL